MEKGAWNMNVKNQEHYTSNAIQPIDYIVANNMDFLEGNVVKYVTRYKSKNGLEDLRKALAYLDLLIARESEDERKPSEVLMDGTENT